MLRRFVAVMVLAFTTLTVRAEEPKRHPVFEMTAVHRLHLEMTAKEFDKLNAVKGGFMMGGNRPPMPVDPPGETVERHKSGGGFGMEFPWARASLSIDGKTLKDVGVRFKGNGSYLPTVGRLKRNFKVDFDHFGEKAKWHGLKTLNLNSGAMDPTRARETLAYAAYREAGVPAPLTSFAEITLTVPGKYDRELIGLYTVVEQLDKAFLKRGFGDAGGLLMKPERLREIDYLGEDWDRYKPRYLPKDEPTPTQARRVMDFAKLVHKGDDAQFAREIGEYLDVENYLRFLAVTSMIANMDNIFFTGHNYCLYLHPDTNKFSFVPWDVDLAFAGFPFFTTSDQQMDLSLIKPYGGTHKFADRLMAIPAITARHREIIKEIATTSFTKEKLLARLVGIEAATKGAAEREAKAVAARKEPAGVNMFPNTPDIRKFLDKRMPSIAAQVAGTSKGFVPPSSITGPRPGGANAGAAFLTKPMFEALDTDKNSRLNKAELLAGAATFFTKADREKKGRLDEKMVADEINRIFPTPPGFGNPGGAGGAAGGFGAGNFMAGPLLRKADADKSGHVTLDELTTLIAATFDRADKAKAGSLDEKQLAEGFRLLFPPQPGFGQPPGVPKEEKKP